MLVPTHDVDDSIRRITEAQNSKGLRVIGWCHAPKETDQAISETKIMHIVYCGPASGLTDEALLLRLKPVDIDAAAE